jgi:hypothetical protein
MEVGGMLKAKMRATATAGLLVAASGCSPSMAAPASHTFVRGDAVKVVVQGGGVVRGGPIECGAERARCAAALNELWSTELVAHPQPGWSFTGWRRSFEHPKLSHTSGFQGETVVETAIFERSDAVATTAQTEL